VEREPVGDRRHRHGGAEAVGLADSPGRHEAAVARADDRDPVAVGDPLGHDGVHAGEDVAQVATAHVAQVGARKRLSAARAAARVRQQDRVAAREHAGHAGAGM
jgi:hypothetical protein